MEWHEKDYYESDRHLTDLFNHIERWSSKYEFSFQFWGSGNNNVYICKGGVDMFDAGGHETPIDIIEEALQWVYTVNRVPMKNRILLKRNSDLKK